MVDRVLEKKVALITGGSQGIGFAIAEMFIQHGFSVAICARNADMLQMASERLATLADSIGLGGRVFWKSLNVGNPRSIQGFVEDAACEFGGLDVIVNNAVNVERKPFENMSIEELSGIASANVLGAWICTHAALPYLKQSSLHLIVNILSEMDSEPLTGFVTYASSKGAITAFTKAIAAEFDPRVVKAIGIRPRRVRTATWNRVRAGDESYYVPADVAKLLEKLVFVSSDTIQSGQIVDLKETQPISHRQRD